MVSGKEGRSFLSSPHCTYAKARDMPHGTSQQVQGLGEDLHGPGAEPLYVKASASGRDGNLSCSWYI